jgi:hypothetical protein
MALVVRVVAAMVALETLTPILVATQQESKKTVLLTRVAVAVVDKQTLVFQT